MSNPLRGLSHTLAALTNNCSGFHRAWEAAIPGSSGERWAGEWRSETNGHHGALRCVLQRTADGEVTAWFHARYARWLRVCYQTTLRATQKEAGWVLEGETDLGGLAGGVYKYRGELNERRLHCQYECRYDRGVFELKPQR